VKTNAVFSSETPTCFLWFIRRLSVSEQIAQMIVQCRMSWYWSNRGSVAAFTERTEKNHENL